MSFPADRFARAGAGADQLAQLAADFDQLPPIAQQSFLDRIGGLAAGDLTEIIHALDEPVEIPAVEVTDEPLAGTGDAINAVTGEVTPAGQPLPELPAEPDAKPLVTPDAEPEPAPGEHGHWVEDPPPEASPGG